MTDSLKLSEMHRTSIEFERQRHLANWFIKSSPHMANSSQSYHTDIAAGGGGNNSNSNSNHTKAQQMTSNNVTKTGTITTINPLFLLMSTGQKIPVPPPLPPPPLHHVGSSGGGGGGVNLAMPRSQIFASQSNLPLQIVTSGQEGHKKVKRFNSHDTSANMFSVAEFENARLARRNEIELKQRQQRLKINSLGSGGDCSTGDSKGSKYSSDSQPEILPADTFLERYPLPRIARISYKLKYSHETLQSTSSNGSLSSNSSCLVNKNLSFDPSNQKNGELLLLYRHLKQNIYHGYNSKHRKKGFKIPQEFPGYFSLINEKGTSVAVMYTTLIQLVRERVYKFISIDNMPAFTESQTTTNTFQTRTHYVKTTARGGQIFRLLAVFEDGKQDTTINSSSSSNNKNMSRSGGGSSREKEKGRYAQLLGENRQILYVSLTTKGKFYEIEPSVPQMLQKPGLLSEDKKRAINADCVHRIGSLVNSENVEQHKLPLNLKYISGPSNLSNGIMPEYLTITRVSSENTLIACPIEDIEMQTSSHLKKIHISPDMMLTKCFLGFENESRLLANQNIQNILKFCQFNCDHFIKMIDSETFIAPSSSQPSQSFAENLPLSSSSKGRTESLKILKPLNFPRLLRREKSVVAHERENSIIFLSKNDLANLESTKGGNAAVGSNNSNANQNRISDKMKVFQSSKKKWFRRSDKNNSLTNLDFDMQAKRMSMERYNDVSKLLQERFGSDAPLTTTQVDFSINKRPVSEIGCSTSTTAAVPAGAAAIAATIDKRFTSAVIQKSFSLQEVDKQPDLVPVNFKEQESFNIGNKDIEEQEAKLSSSSHHLPQQQQRQQSFISDKMFTEFHVKTKQHSKSSSSLHQLLNFAVPSQRSGAISDKIDIKKDKTELLSRQFCKNFELSNCYSDLNLGEISIKENLSPPPSLITTTIIDDLPYSSVRDSLLDDSVGSSIDGGAAIYNRTNEITSNFNDDLKENIYAEICHDNGNVYCSSSISNANGNDVGVGGRGGGGRGKGRGSISDEKHFVNTNNHSIRVEINTKQQQQ